MTVETLLMTGIGSVTAALVYVSKLLMDRAMECERDRDQLRITQHQMQIEFATLQRQVGRMDGELASFKNCWQPGCPFKQGNHAGG